MDSSERVDSIGINRLAVRLQTLHFMKSLFVNIQSFLKSKMEILVGISVFVEASNSLLPTLGRSANLSEPWAPRKDISRSFAHFLQKTFQILSNATRLQSLWCEAL